MATWNSKKICNLLNLKISKKPGPFEVIDTDLVAITNIWKAAAPGRDPRLICDIIEIQEKYNFSLIEKIKGYLSDFNHKIDVILDIDGNVSIIIYPFRYDRVIKTIATPTETLEVQRNPAKSNGKIK